MAGYFFHGMENMQICRVRRVKQNLRLHCPICPFRFSCRHCSGLGLKIIDFVSLSAYLYPSAVVNRYFGLFCRHGFMSGSGMYILAFLFVEGHCSSLLSLVKLDDIHHQHVLRVQDVYVTTFSTVKASDLVYWEYICRFYFDNLPSNVSTSQEDLSHNYGTLSISKNSSTHFMYCLDVEVNFYTCLVFEISDLVAWDCPSMSIVFTMVIKDDSFVDDCDFVLDIV